MTRPAVWTAWRVCKRQVRVVVCERIDYIRQEHTVRSISYTRELFEVWKAGKQRQCAIQSLAFKVTGLSPSKSIQTLHLHSDVAIRTRADWS
jgi:hypothetical protein